MNSTAHRVLFYEADATLIESLRELVGDALAEGEAALVMATALHRRALNELLLADGIDVPAAQQRGQYTALDAGEVLATFMRDGRGDGTLTEMVGGTILSAAARYGQVRAFGEMVGLLVEAGDPEAAMKLEGLWNDLQARVPLFSLLCGYSEKQMERAPSATLPTKICTAHSAVIPAGSSAGGRPLDPLETTYTILTAAPRQPRTLDFFVEVARRFGLDPTVVETSLQTLEVAGDACRDHQGRWSARRR